MYGSACLSQLSLCQNKTLLVFFVFCYPFSFFHDCSLILVERGTTADEVLREMECNLFVLCFNQGPGYFQLILSQCFFVFLELILFHFKKCFLLLS